MGWQRRTQRAGRDARPYKGWQGRAAPTHDFFPTIDLVANLLIIIGVHPLGASETN